jgi:F-type H+-transporting ATPase subunit b
MSDTLSLLEHYFLSSVPTVVFVVILVVILERLFFRPIAEVMNKRAEETMGALARARKEVSAAEAKFREYDAALQAARLEVYRLRQQERGKALATREAALQTARERAAELAKSAQASLAAEVSVAKRQLLASSQSLAMEITERILQDGALPTAGGSAGA